MRYSLTVSDALNSEIETLAASAEISKNAWIINACTTFIKSSTGGGEDVEAERDRMQEELQTITADRDRLKVQVEEVDRLRADLDTRDRMLAEKAEEVRWLRGEVSKLNDKLIPAAIPEQTGPGRKPWWLFWR